MSNCQLFTHFYMLLLYRTHGKERDCNIIIIIIVELSSAPPALKTSLLIYVLIGVRRCFSKKDAATPTRNNSR